MTALNEAEAAARKAVGQSKRAANVYAEQWFDLQHAVYARKDIAKIGRGHFPVRGAPGKMRPVGKGDVDFFGVAKYEAVPMRMNVCTALAFDLKVNRVGEFRIDVKDSLSTLNQLDFLIDFHRCGGKAFLGLLDPDAGEFWMLGDPAIHWLKGEHKITYRHKSHGSPWRVAPEWTHAVHVVPEASTEALARTGIRFDYLPMLAHL